MEAIGGFPLPPPARTRHSLLRHHIAPLASGSTAIGLLVGIYHAWLNVTNPTIVALSFLLVVLLVASVATRWVAIATSLLAFVCFNFFFLPPVRTFTIADPQNWIALFTLLAVSIVASHLSSQARRQAQDAMARRDELARLFGLTRDILLTTDAEDAITVIAQWIGQRFGFEQVAICLPSPEGWAIHQFGKAVDLDRAQLNTVFASAQLPASTDSLQPHVRTSLQAPDGAALTIVPLRVGLAPLGLLAVEDREVEPGTLDAIAGVTAIAIERTHLLQQKNEAEVLRRSAELKSALLASLGHDLKTPLTAVTLAATNLNASWLSDDQRREQGAIVVSELGRLNRLFRDIVDMAKIETDAVVVEREWVQPSEIAEAAARQVAPALERHVLQIADQAERVFVLLDPRLTSAALAHLLENAAQYSPAGAEILVTVTVSSDELQLSVRDKGRGVAPEEFDRLFDRFFRGAAARQHTFGTGMGLAITRGLVAAEGGRVWAENAPGGGALFTIAVPAATQSAAALAAPEI